MKKKGKRSGAAHHKKMMHHHMKMAMHHAGMHGKMSGMKEERGEMKGMGKKKSRPKKVSY